jgi:lipopolysaccharide export system permease protein
MLPPATLIAVIILFGLMKKNNEIMALKSCGLNILRLSQPLIVFSLFLASIVFIISEVVVPFTSTKSNDIWRVDVRKKEKGRFYGRTHIWYRGADCIYWIKYFDNQEMAMRDPSLFFFNSSFKFRKRIDARTGIWKNGKWQIKDGIMMKADNNGYVIEKFKEIDLELPETPETFVREKRKPEEMGYWQLKRFAQEVKAEGYDATEYFVDLNIKTSFPFIILVMVLVGIPIALQKMKGGTPVAVSIGMVFCFVYLLVLGLSRSFGFADILPAFLSAWLANAIFLLFGIYLMMHMDR